MEHVILIPAFNPDEKLLKLVGELKEQNFNQIVVINDGSDANSDSIFDQLEQDNEVTILPHATNLGKGAGLKTGLNYIYCNYPNLWSVITADADGQHKAEDIKAIAEKSKKNFGSLILGARQFSAKIPFRSAFGNIVTKYVFRFFSGITLSDTQSGLRAIPKSFIPALLKIKSNNYEYETEMLLKTKHNDIPIAEHPIETIYIAGNESSHFNPVLDSFKIYFVLLRFFFTSVISTVLDYLAFYIVFKLSSNTLHSVYIARAFALGLNFLLVKSFVFRFKENSLTPFLKYLCLVIFMAFISYSSIEALSRFYGVNILVAKMATEGFLFFSNFAIQRSFIFRRSKAKHVPSS